MQQQVDIWLGDAVSKLPLVSAAKGRPIDLLLLDGLPKETLQYLKAAEPYLAPGALVIADNAGVAGLGWSNGCAAVWCALQCAVCWAVLHTPWPGWRTSCPTLALLPLTHAGMFCCRAGVFAEGGLKDYLQYVRGSSSYSSRFIESTFEWRDDVPDGMEVSVYQPAEAVAAQSN